MNIGPFFATLKYFSNCSLPVVFVDVVPSDDKFSEKVASDVTNYSTNGFVQRESFQGNFYGGICCTVSIIKSLPVQV